MEDQLFREPKNKMEEIELKFIKDARQEVFERGEAVWKEVSNEDLLPSVSRSIFETVFLPRMLNEVPDNLAVPWRTIWQNAFGSLHTRVRIVDDHTEHLICITPPVSPSGVYDFSNMGIVGAECTFNIISGYQEAVERTKLNAQIRLDERLNQFADYMKSPEVLAKIEEHKKEWGKIFKLFRDELRPDYKNPDEVIEVEKTSEVEDDDVTDLLLL